MESERLADMFKALGNPHRLQIFLRLVNCCPPAQRWVADGPGRACVGELGRALGIVPSTVSHHIKELQRAGLIATERNGQTIECWIDPEAMQVLAAFFVHPPAGAGAEAPPAR